MDPQERLFLESCWQALEDAGYTREQLQASPSGPRRRVCRHHQDRLRAAWAGALAAGRAAASPHTSFGSVANRVSYLLNLHGPSMPIDTMCSSSLTAIHEACEHLHRDECELAIAGGVNLYLHPRNYVELCALRMLSRTAGARASARAATASCPARASARCC